MRTLDLLSAVQHKNAIQKLSWVPRWNICSASTLAPLGSNLKKYNAARRLLPPSIRWTGNWGQFLHVEGIEFDSFTKTGQVMTESEIPNEPQATLMSILSQILAEASPYPTGESLNQVACFTLTAGKDGYGMMVENMQQHLANFNAFWTNRVCVTNRSLPRLLSDISGDADCFLLAAQFACVGRIIFHTSRGYIGVSPAPQFTGYM
jgi:hypothetical protein